MTIFRQPALTAEQLRTIASEAVADVTRQKITTSKSTVVFTFHPEKMFRSEPNSSRSAIMAGRAFNPPAPLAINQQLAGFVPSLEEARGYFKEAFNNVRKGR